MLLLLLDCTVHLSCKTQCPADSFGCLQYLHSQEEFTVWTLGVCQPMWNILCICTFAVQACQVACHTQCSQISFLLDDGNGRSCYGRSCYGRSCYGRSCCGVRASSESVQLATQQISSSCFDPTPLLRLQQCVILIAIPAGTTIILSQHCTAFSISFDPVSLFLFRNVHFTLDPNYSETHGDCERHFYIVEMS